MAVILYPFNESIVGPPVWRRWESTFPLFGNHDYCDTVRSDITFDPITGGVTTITHTHFMESEEFEENPPRLGWTRLTSAFNGKAPGDEWPKKLLSFPRFKFEKYNLKGEYVPISRKYNPSTGKWEDLEKLKKSVKLSRQQRKRLSGNLKPNCLMYVSSSFGQSYPGVSDLAPIGVEFKKQYTVPDPDGPEGATMEVLLPHWSYTGNPLKPYTGPYADMVRGSFNWLHQYKSNSNDPLETYAEQIAELTTESERLLYKNVLNQKVDLATALAEGAQSIRLLADVVKRLSSIFSALNGVKRGDFSKLTRAVKDALPLTRKKLANDYLAFKYGVEPLISDVQGAVEEIADWLELEPKFSAKGKRKRTFELEPIETTEGFLSVYRETTLEITVKIKVIFKIDDKVMSSLERLGFTNPAKVSWELVPFSFVVDWFLPIGNFLRDLEAMHGLTVVQTVKTIVVREHTTVEAYCPPETPVSDAYVSVYTSPMIAEKVTVVRELIPVPPLPIPTFKNPLSAGHITNAVALFLQRLK